MAEISGQAVGYIVAACSASGEWTTDTLGLWDSPEEAEADRVAAQQASVYHDDPRWAICAVVPIGEPG